MVRCFIGIMIPEDQKNKIEQIGNKLKNTGIEVKFVERENLHINISFLGEISQERINEIRNNLEEIVKRYKNLKIKIGDLLLIPNQNFIRVIALDVLDETKQLKSLMQEVNLRIGGDYKPPHLTLCRVKRNVNKEKFFRDLEEIKKENQAIEFEVSGIDFIKSELAKSGPVYTVLYKILFR